MWVRCALVTLSLVSVASAQRWMVRWSYNCTRSVYEWGVNYPACQDSDRPSSQQSPIDLMTAHNPKGRNYREASTPFSMEVKFMPTRYKGNFDLLLEIAPSSTDLQILSLKHEEIKPGDCLSCESSAVVVSRDLYLSRVAFHHPSEHTVDGKRFPVEVQLFLKGSVYDEVESVAVSVFGITTSPDFVTPDIKELTDSLVSFSGTYSSVSKDFNAAALLPTNGGFFTYNGSDTSPPCQGKMQWLLMEHTLNFTSDILTALRQQISQFHGEGSGNARPVRGATNLDLQYHPSNGALLKSGGVVRETYVQRQLHLNGKAIHPSISTIPPTFLDQDPYQLLLFSQCTVKAKSSTTYAVQPNTNPAILSLNPDITVVREVPPFQIPPPNVPPHVPQGNPGHTVTETPPRGKFAEWTKQMADIAALRSILKSCEGAQSSDPMCGVYKAMLPPGTKVYANVPLPPLPRVPEPRFIPSNWPIDPMALNTPSSPDALVNPYNPNGDRLPEFDAQDPLSGQDSYMHKPNLGRTLFMKPMLEYPPVYPGGEDVNDDPVVLER